MEKKIVEVLKNKTLSMKELMGTLKLDKTIYNKINKLIKDEKIIRVKKEKVYSYSLKKIR